MLRIDVNRKDDGKPYAIPRDNPFVGNPKYRPEIWAMGLRNPWKWTFHPATGALWAADVGQGEWEEVSIVPRGGNMGWRRLEGKKCFEASGCSRKGMTAPLFTLPRSEARSITGGEFFTAKRASRFHGAYVFGDYETGTVWSLSPRDGRRPVKIGAVPSVSSFARDSKGDVYALGLKDGMIRKLEFP
jgi:glucose/arabinose dehydrogenase